MIFSFHFSWSSLAEPGTLVVGKDAYFKRAEAHASYDGMEAGIIVQNEETGEISYRQGTLKLPGETLVGGYAEVFRKDRSHSFRMEVSFDEYAGKKKVLIPSGPRNPRR